MFFVYLGSQVNKVVIYKQDINMRIKSANRYYYGMLNHLKSTLLICTTTIKAYKTLIKPLLMYVS